ncbi:MAG: aquaporin [Chloroflexota bacterium]|nr:aquaporin [Chloroflexota bacterium]
MNGNLKPAIAELVGTFALTFIGGAAIANGQAGLVGVAFAHGLTLMIMIYVLGAVSGTHVNSAVTLGLALGKQIAWSKAVVYWIAQFVGAIIAGFALLVIFADPSAKTGFLGTPFLAANVSMTTGILLEAILTFFLVLAVYGTAVDSRAPKGFAGLAIGLVLTMDILAGGPLTGAAMNPARYLGTAVASGHLGEWLVYFIGPAIGAVVAWAVYTYGLAEK